MSLNNQSNNELYGGFGYKDYYDMVEKSAKKLSDDKQKAYSASGNRKKCETKQKEILKSLIKNNKKITEKIKLAKKDISKITNTTEKENIEKAKEDIRKELSEEGNKNPELRFLDCTSGKLLKYLIRIKLKNYKKCLIEQKKSEKQLKKSSKKGSSQTTDKAKDCSKKENFLKIVKKETVNNKDIFFLNTTHILKLINDLISIFKKFQEELNKELQKQEPKIRELNSKNLKKNPKSNIILARISQNEIIKILEQITNKKINVPLTEEQMNSKVFSDQKGGGSCNSDATAFFWWGLAFLILYPPLGLILLFIAFMISTSCSMEYSIENTYRQTYTVRQTTNQNQNYNQNYNQQYKGPNVRKATGDVARGTFMAMDSISNNIAKSITRPNVSRSFSPSFGSSFRSPSFGSSSLMGLSFGTGLFGGKGDIKDKQSINIDALIEQVKITIEIFEKFRKDIEKFKINKQMKLKNLIILQILHLFVLLMQTILVLKKEKILIILKSY